MQLFRPTFEIDECLASLRRILESGWTGTGPECKQFEEEWNGFIGSKYSLFLNSATAALHIAIRLLNLPKQSKILTTPLTFVSTNAVILYEGHEPVFVDVNEEDLSLCSADFANKKKQSDAKAAIWVHYGGQISPHFYSTLNANKDLQFIEDCAHASGAYYEDGSRVGSKTNTISCFSYHSVKNLPTFDSGMLCCPSASMLERARRLSWMGIDKDTYSRTNSNDLYKWYYQVSELGWKYNGNDIAACIARVQLKFLDRDNEIRRRHFYSYKRNFDGYPQITLLPHLNSSAPHLIVIRVKNRDELIMALKKRGISPGVHYLPNFEFPVFQKYYQKGSCPNAERISNEILSLPNHLKLTQSDIDFVSEVVIQHAKT